MNTNHVLAGAVAGFVAAFGVDVHAWASSPTADAFDWRLAVKRWVGGAIAGAIAGLGIASAGQ